MEPGILELGQCWHRLNSSQGKSHIKSELLGLLQFYFSLPSFWSREDFRIATSFIEEKVICEMGPCI